MTTACSNQLWLGTPAHATRLDHFGLGHRLHCPKTIQLQSTHQSLENSPKDTPPVPTVPGTFKDIFG